MLFNTSNDVIGVWMWLMNIISCSNNDGACSCHAMNLHTCCLVWVMIYSVVFLLRLGTNIVETCGSSNRQQFMSI